MNSETQTLITAASPLLMAVVAWFVRGMFTELKEMTREVREHTTQIAVMNVAITQVQRDQAALEFRMNDLQGFLQNAGFRKRDGASNG